MRCCANWNFDTDRIQQKVEFKYYDVMGNENLKRVFEESANEAQPTLLYPQIYAKEKIVAGLDMIKELLQVKGVYLRI